MYWQNTSFQVPRPSLFEITMTTNPTHLLVMTSCKGSIAAKKIANAVISQNFGTSAQIINGVNTFIRWVGKVENSEEQLIVIKTSNESYDDLVKCTKRLHPHELPEIIGVPIISNSTDS
jgi:periplasmic divalent cation tolerance protein